MGEVITDSIESVNLRNDNFASVCTDEETGNLPEPLNIFKNTLDESVQNIEITIAAAQEKRSQMKPNKAPGIDNINSSMLREVASSIASPLCEIYKGSIETGEVPLD